MINQKNNISRLIASLDNSKLVITNNALYQTIKGLIKISGELNEGVNDALTQLIDDSSDLDDDTDDDRNQIAFGLDGIDGIDGIRGMPGQVGLRGPMGLPGLDGIDGIIDDWFPRPSPVIWPAVVTQTTTLTGNQDDLALVPNCRILYCKNTSLLTIRGLTPGTEGQHLTIIAVGSQVNLAHQNASSTAVFRLANFITSGITPLAASYGEATYVYYAIDARWRLIVHEQGAWIDIPYVGTDFTADAGTWTVDSGDLLGWRYYLQGRKLTLSIVTTTTTTNGVNIRLFALIPNSYTISTVVNNICYTQPAGGASMAGIVQVNNLISTTQIAILKIDITAWADGVNNNHVSATLIFPID